MQSLVCYVNASGTLGIVRDYSNSRNESAPTFTRGVEAGIKLRLFFADELPEPYPLAPLQAIASWQFVIDKDFDSETAYILVADHENITVSSVTETINDVERTFTEVFIPIPDMNTEELVELIGSSESVSGLNGELVGFDSDANEVFVLQIKGFTVRNRISSTGNPTEIDPEYLTEAQVRALCSAGLDVIFAETASETASDWHSTQTTSDKFFRVRLKGDSRTWTSGSAADAGWSDCFGLLVGATGADGADGATYYCHAAFATAADGTGFITDATDWTAAHKFIAFLTTTKTAAQISASDFAGLWIKFIIDDAANINIADAGGYFTGTTVEAALQELGASLDGLDAALGGI